MQTRTLDETDLGRALEIRNRSFGMLADAVREDYTADMRRAIGEERLLGVYDGSLLVGRALIRDFRQWWGGRSMAMAGIAGVVVAPEFRGRGVGSALMAGLIDRCRELGYPLSVLYPATLPVYRSQGWELAGSQHRFTFDTSLLRDLRGGQVAVRQADAADAPRLVELTRRLYAVGRACGPNETHEAELREELADPATFGYLADSGFVVFGWQQADLVVHTLLAADAGTARALWAVVGSGSSVAKQVHAYLAPDDAVSHLVAGSPSATVQQNRWMLRCLDVRAALTSRGYPLGLSVDIPVVLDDAQVEANRVAGRLQVDEGSALVVEGPAEPGSVRLGANGVAALFAGIATAPLLAAGLLSGGDGSAHAALDAAFVARPAHLLEYF